MSYSRRVGEANSPKMWSHPTSLEPVIKVGKMLLKMITKGQNPEHQMSQTSRLYCLKNCCLTKEATNNTLME
jgi:hypothetical protein